MNEIHGVQQSMPLRAAEYPLLQQRAVEASVSSSQAQLHADSDNAGGPNDGGTANSGMQQPHQGMLEAFIESTQRLIQFAVDKESRRTIIKVVDPQTKEVIRQIPPEEALKISRMISRLYKDRGVVTDERI